MCLPAEENVHFLSKVTIHTDMLPHCIFRAVVGSFLLHLEDSPVTSISLLTVRGNILHLNGHSQPGTPTVKGDRDREAAQGTALSLYSSKISVV